MCNIGDVGKVASAPFTGGASLIPGADSVWGSLTGRTGRQDAQDAINAGNAKASNELTGGPGSASGGIPAAKNELNTGFNAAKAQYQAPDVVSSRNELYSRVLGKGGLDSGTIGKLKANTIDQYGQAGKDVGTRLNSYYGDSSAPGLAGENLAKAQATLGANRASDLRGIDIGNAELARTEMTNAIPALKQFADTSAGLNVGQGQAESGLTTEEAAMLAQIASGGGAQLASLQDQTNYLPGIANMLIKGGTAAATGGKSDGGKSGGTT